MKRWQLILTFVSVFIAGALSGGLTATRFFHPFGPHPKPSDMTARMMRSLKSEVNLTPDQVEKIQPIVARTMEQMVGFHHELSGRIHVLIDASDQEIESYLDPKQKAQFESMRAKRRRPPD
jgi:Spy/CpxP family protein refolding chaperone